MGKRINCSYIPEVLVKMRVGGVSNNSKEHSSKIQRDHRH